MDAATPNPASERVLAARIRAAKDIAQACITAGVVSPNEERIFAAAVAFLMVQWGKGSNH